MRMKILLLLLIFIGSGFIQPLQAILKVGVTQGQVAPTPIAVTPVFADSVGSEDMAYKMTAMIEADLERCGLFRPIEQRAFIQTGESLRKKPRFDDWKLIKAQLLTVGTLELMDGKYKLSLSLYDVLTGLEMGKFEVTDVSSNWRKIAHKVSDHIYKRVTGEEGYFSTKIVYVSETGPNRDPVKKLAVMDQDGANHNHLTDGSADISLPVFSPTAQIVAYAAYHRKEQAKIFLMNLDTRQTQLFVDQSKMQGVAFAPRFAHDGRRLIFSIAAGGTTSIYTKEIIGGEMKRITQHIGAIDTSPCYSPDGSRIVFESDMSGKRHLYTMNADGSNVQRISKGGGSGFYADPIWSPRGDLIAFVKMQGGSFYIGVMRPDGSGERLIEKGYQVEKPTWSPNGRVILYKTQGAYDSKGKVIKRVYSVDLTGFNRREIPTPANAEMPAWSPLVP